MMRKLSTKLTKSYILERIDQVYAMADLMNVSVDDIFTSIKTNRPINAKYRHDKGPSLSFYINSSVLFAHDHGRQYHKNVIDLAADRLSFILPLSPYEFMQCLEFLNIHYNVSSIKPELLTRRDTFVALEDKHYEYYVRGFNNQDLKFWKTIYVTEDILNRKNVFALFELFINGKRVYRYKLSDPAYIYEFHDGAFQIYFPYRDKYKQVKFITNRQVIFGGRDIKQSDVGIIIKSYKDLLFMANYEHLGVDLISVPAENYMLNSEQMEFVRSYWKCIYTFSDYDRTGILFGLRMKKLYNTKPLFLTNGLGDSINFMAKDPTDYVQKYGKSNFDQMFEYVKTNGLEDYDSFMLFCNTLNHFTNKQLGDLPYF